VHRSYTALSCPVCGGRHGVRSWRTSEFGLSCFEISDVRYIASLSVILCWSVSRQASSPIESEFYLVLAVCQFPASSCSLKAMQKLLVSSSSFSDHFFPSLYLSFSNVFQKAVPAHDLTNSVSLSPFYCMYLSSLTLCNTSSFFTQSVQLIFCILLQHHVSKVPVYFWSTARSVQVPAPYKAMIQM
jgi:hypothetical protein